MPLDPTDFRTWTSFADHPIFGDTRAQISDWSSNPSQYEDLNHFPNKWIPGWYIHRDPAPAVEFQEAAATVDIELLATTCSALQEASIEFVYELIVLDDFTVFVWVKGVDFEILIYPHTDVDPEFPLFIGIYHPITNMDDQPCRSVTEVVALVKSLVE